MNNITKVQLFKDDFRVCLLALMECQTAWRGMIDEGDLPDIPGLDLGKAQHILIRFSEVKDKIQTILDGQPLAVSNESYEKIMKIMEDDAQHPEESGNNTQ